METQSTQFSLLMMILEIFSLKSFFYLVENEKEAEKLKSSLMKEGWRKDEWRMMNEEWRMMKDEGWILKEDDFKLLRGFGYGQNYGHWWL